MPSDSILQTDDLGVFNTNLSNELRIAQSTFDLTRNDIFKLMENAIHSSFASESEKAALFAKLILFNENHLELSEIKC